MSSALVLFGAFRSIGQGQSLGLNPAKCNGTAGGGVHWDSHFAGLAAANFRNPKAEDQRNSEIRSPKLRNRALRLGGQKARVFGFRPSFGFILGNRQK